MVSTRQAVAAILRAAQGTKTARDTRSTKLAASTGMLVLSASLSW